MKKIRIFILLVSMVSLITCEKEAVMPSKDYPFVQTNLPQVNYEGVEFVAEISSLGKSPILKYGFVWSAEPTPTIQNYRKFMDGEPEEGLFSCIVNGGLSKSKTYYVRSYILTEQYEVYGNTESFVSLGSLAPVINGFEPKFGTYGTQVIIDGENFALSTTGNIVKFGNIKVIVKSVSETQLIISIPKITKAESVQVTVETAGKLVRAHDLFNLMVSK